MHEIINLNFNAVIVKKKKSILKENYKGFVEFSGFNDVKMS